MKKLLVIISLLPLSLFAQDEEEFFSQFVLAENLPYELSTHMYQTDFFERFDLNGYLNPFYLRGDFNGDGETDYAISVWDKEEERTDVAIFFTLTEFQLLAHDHLITNRHIQDFDWMDAWYVYDQAEVGMGVGETEEITLSTEALLVQKTEAASGIIYWDGSKWMWYQQGD